MVSKQRVLAALSHKKSDHTPCNYLGTAEVDEKLKNHFNTDNMDVVLENLGVDLRIIDAPYVGPSLRKWEDGRIENYWGHIRKPVHNQTGTYYEAAEFPYADFKTLHDVESFRWPKPEWFDYSKIESACKKYSDYATVYGDSGNMNLINGTAFGRGFEQVLCDIAIEDPIGLACMEQRFECCYQVSKKALEISNGNIDILWIGDDYGTQNGLLISPKIWRKIFYSKLKSMCDLGHKYGVKVMLHCCGSSKVIWHELIEAGVDIYDTIQPEAAEMDPAQLKIEFGNNISFHGTISTQKTLPFASSLQVAEEVRRRIRTVGKNGGLILAPAHNIQADTPLANILAMYETVRTGG